ncbi:MAG: SCO family protein [Candidatus Tectomicrobia bacterium]|uniref:SCO family protein n=1 Tax=Tectimicrobiota bacterium TaxID=2528274 RepID=A0A932FYS6_UNCTE|nr:SCO family protein [Candidatus Tectomicrobia bacterium]
MKTLRAGHTPSRRSPVRRPGLSAFALLFLGFFCLSMRFDTLPIPPRVDRPTTNSLRNVGFDQRLNAQIPLDLAFRDEAGRPVRLGTYFGPKPVILLLNYLKCPTLCPMVLDQLTHSLQRIRFDVGREFAVVTVSIDPRETPQLAAAQKAAYLRSYGRPGAAQGWHFLTGDPGTIQRLARAIGFRYTYDARQDRYIHPAGLVVLTPQGRIARYFFGPEFLPRDLRLGLVEASANRIGSPIDQVLLICYHYDPTTGKYGLVILRVLRWAGLVTVLAIGVLIVTLVRRERHKKI